MSIAVLSDDELGVHLEKLTGWKKEGGAISKKYGFKGFTQAMEFVNQIAETAEAVNHHPDIDIRYNKVTLVLSTHDSGGITQKDVDLAIVADETASAITAQVCTPGRS